ncbi:hypothetical protein J7W16_03800 [Bacillus sp. YZJH907-2]|uniref:DUF3139 domain-containing protein n=1 Tax=Halalkalibacter suaedae TaxID=2822140 RepID=A0A941AM89_9BACI|nr:hypothetical protein [Bacillus suaedae]
MKKTLLVVLLMFVLSFGFIGVRFGSALIQEGNPIPYLVSIMKLELSNKGYEQAADTLNETSYVSAEKEYPSVVIDFMKEKDWDYKEQIGSGLVFERSQETITISTRKYSKNYFLWNVPNEVLN